MARKFTLVLDFRAGMWVSVVVWWTSSRFPSRAWGVDDRGGRELPKNNLRSRRLSALWSALSSLVAGWMEMARCGGRLYTGRADDGRVKLRESCYGRNADLNDPDQGQKIFRF